ncbi:ABC-three component system protein [Qaidamihabitans albus]|uniref:ABC-three component system protein n=1 Tax=Qaidamihabitans albus TaxID=2795733 RepID=UPI0018F1781C|nr:ABC-three component system protein [Qaidamihabitans albus]
MDSVALDFMERQAVRFLIKMRLSDLHGNSFESFFHELMCLRDPSFLDVRTAGSLGDQGSDGMLLYGNKLYACYAPETYDAKKLVEKFEDDLAKACSKRQDQFNTFVFVHNDQRGMHPAVSKCLADARNRLSGLKFEQFGQKHFRNEVCKLDRAEVEDLLGTQLPVRELTYGVALEELEPLLDHLRSQRLRVENPDDILAVSGRKLDFNEFSDDVKDDLRRMMVRSNEIEAYYAGRVDITERDEVARGFHEEFVRLRGEFDDPDDVLWQLELYVLGNASAPLNRRRAVMAILAYFFETCDIFDNVPPELNGSRGSVKESA